MLRRFLRTLSVGAALVAAAFAQSANNFDPGQIADGVKGYIGQVAAAGVGVLVLTIGLAAAWRYAKKFLKG